MAESSLLVVNEEVFIGRESVRVTMVVVLKVHIGLLTDIVQVGRQSAILMSRDRRTFAASVLKLQCQSCIAWKRAQKSAQRMSDLQVFKCKICPATFLYAGPRSDSCRARYVCRFLARLTQTPSFRHDARHALSFSCELRLP